MFDLVGCLSSAMDLISPAVVGHHKRVGYAAAVLGRAMGLGKGPVSDLLLAGMVHDAGAFSLRSRLDALEFDTRERSHAEIGAKLLGGCSHLRRAQAYVRLHHTDHTEDRRKQETPEDLLGGQIVYVADRVDALLRRDREAVPQAASVRSAIAARAGDRFDPRVVDAFMDVSADNAFWENMVSDNPPGAVMREMDFDNPLLGKDEVLGCSDTFSHIIDFRSRFTATHSKGVAATAQVLAQLADSNEVDPDLITLAGNLHDIGKLAVPAEYIDKPGPLSEDEFSVMKRHPEIGHGIMSCVAGMERIDAWATNHHERPNGSGYPSGLTADALDLGSRIMAVADVFTAVMEDRPYRAGMDKAQALGVLTGMADEGSLDSKVVGMLKGHFGLVNLTRVSGQAKALRAFQTLMA